MRDTTDFLNYLPKQVDKDEVLVSLDAASLYSNINHALAIESIDYWITNHPGYLDSRFSKGFILESITLILKNNTFTFDNREYIQKIGTAMGTKMAPTLATLVLGFLELSLYNKIGDRYGNDIKLKIEERFKRFLDDIFIILNPNEIKADDFIGLLNDLDERINFTGKQAL